MHSLETFLTTYFLILIFNTCVIPGTRKQRHKYKIINNVYIGLMELMSPSELLLQMSVKGNYSVKKC